MDALARIRHEPAALDLLTLPDPVAGPGDVIVGVAAAGLCGSDLEAYHRALDPAAPLPRVPGHEFAGRIVDLGPGVDGWTVGDRVVSETAAYVCGRCALCRTGHYNLCPARLGFGFGVDGAFAPYVRVPTRCLHRVPADLPFHHAALTEPACVTYNAVVEKSRVAPGDMVVVVGSGTIGLLALQWARRCGASVVLVGVSGDEARLAAARELGALATYDALVDDVDAAVRAMTDGLGVPLVVDTVGGAAASLDLALRLVRPGGQITKVGWFAGTTNTTMDVLVAKAVRLQGSFSHTWPMWERCLAALADGTIDMGPIISDDLPLSRWQEGYRRSADRTAVKVVFRPGGASA
jgi:alcohol dehydrogenase/L-iditol 2-dehydrogenase